MPRWLRRLWRWASRSTKRRARKIAREIARDAEREAVKIVRNVGERARDALDNDRPPPPEEEEP